ncbi:hypothetical protein [Kitasatospora aureofaciens]
MDRITELLAHRAQPQHATAATEGEAAEAAGVGAGEQQPAAVIGRSTGCGSTRSGTRRGSSRR